MDKPSNSAFSNGLEEIVDSHDVAPEKWQGVSDASIDMCFGGEVDHIVCIFQYPTGGLVIRKVTSDESVRAAPAEALKVTRVATRAHVVEVDYFCVVPGFYDVTDEVASDESKSTGNDDSIQSCLFLNPRDLRTCSLRQQTSVRLDDDFHWMLSGSFSL